MVMCGGIWCRDGVECSSGAFECGDVACNCVGRAI